MGWSEEEHFTWVDAAKASARWANDVVEFNEGVGAGGGGTTGAATGTTLLTTGGGILVGGTFVVVDEEATGGWLLLVLIGGVTITTVEGFIISVECCCCNCWCWRSLNSRSCLNVSTCWNKKFFL